MKLARNPFSLLFLSADQTAGHGPQFSPTLFKGQLRSPAFRDVDAYRGPADGGVVGVVDVGVVGDVAMLPELNPHNPDTPIVPMPEDVDIPEIGSNPGSSDVPAVWPLPDAEMVSDIGAVPAAAAVADPIAIPPPS